MLDDIWIKIEQHFWEKGFGVGRQEKMIMFQLRDGREKYMSELLKELSKNHPEEKWNQTTLNVRVDNLKNLGFLEEKTKDYKIYVKLSNYAQRCINLFSKWREDIRREGRKNEGFSDSNDNY